MTAVGLTHCERTGKVQHVTKSKAVRLRDRLARRGNGPPCEVYKCTFCHLFHIGNADFTTKVRSK